MNTKVEAQPESANGAVDAIKWLLVAVLVIGGVFGYHHFDQYPVLYRVLALIPVVALALFAAVWTQAGGAFWDLAKLARVEWYKIVWPTRQETTQTTMIVLAVVFVIALILWMLDWFFGMLASLIIG